MCSFYAKHNPEFAKIYENEKINYSSWAIQNDILNICAKNLKETIIGQVQESGMFSIQCDEAR